MKQYPTYKESGIQWIGLIPEHWEVSKLKNLAHKLQSGGTPEAGSASFYTDRGDGIPWVTIGDMSTVDSIKDTAKHITEEGRLNKNLKIFPKGTLLYSIYATIGKVSELACPATINQAILAISLRDGYFQPYCKYALKAQETFVVSFASANTQANLNAEKVSNFIMPVPHPPEQQAIAQFLDSKTAKIDETISLYEQQKTDLVEYRKALISDTVTRGLNPNVPLKDSGIQWLGQIPEGWNVSKIKYCCDVFGRIGFRGYTTEDMVPAGEGAITLSPSNIKDGKMSFDKLAYLSWAKYEESPEIQIQVGDILLTKTGSSYGKCAYVDYLPMEATINPQFVVLKNFHENAKYLAYIMQTPMIKKQEEDSVVGGAIPTMAQEDINNFVLPLPSLAEQQAIVSFLDSKTAMIDEAIHCIDEQIADLKAYRTALITDAVTGKIDVRNE